MLKNKNKFINILLCLWQLPQIILGCLMLLFFRNKERYVNEYNNVIVWRISHRGVFGSACFSTGPFVITVKKPSEEILRHETGHSLQSIYFGPVYHLIISIPSICRFWFRRLFKKSHEWYNSGYPEDWADHLGGVNELKNNLF